MRHGVSHHKIPLRGSCTFTTIPHFLPRPQNFSLPVPEPCTHQNRDKNAAPIRQFLSYARQFATIPVFFYEGPRNLMNSAWCRGTHFVILTTRQKTLLKHVNSHVKSHFDILHYGNTNCISVDRLKWLNPALCSFHGPSPKWQTGRQNQPPSLRLPSNRNPRGHLHVM